MGDDGGNNGNGSALPRWLRRLALASLALATVFTVRRFMIDRADAEFERRLMEADQTRD